jgi:hypothetical protein
LDLIILIFLAQSHFHIKLDIFGFKMKLFVEVHESERCQKLRSIFLIESIIHGKFDRVPNWFWDTIINRQVFNVLEEDYRSAHVIISGVEPAIIYVVEVQNDWRSIIQAVKLQNDIFCFVVKRVVGLLDHYCLDNLVIWSPYFNVRV